MIVYASRFSLSWTHLANVRLNIFHVLRKLLVTQGSIDNVGLAVTEYLTNLLRHAEADGSVIWIEITRSKQRLYIQIKDQTQTNHALTVTQSQINSQNDELKEGGMGIALIHGLFPDFEYIQNDNVNCFTLPIQFDSHAKKNIVIVDDSSANSQLIKQYLLEHYDVVNYEDPKEALPAILRELPDIVIVDMLMPAMCGDELILQLKAHEKMAQTKIIIYTGYTSSDAAKRANVMGIDAVIQKPATKQQLLQLVEMLLSKGLLKDRPEDSQSASDVIELGNINGYPRGAVNSTDSGDIFFTLPCKNGYILVLCDVMGHGATAGQLRDKVYGLFYGMVIAGITSPEQLMRQFSNVMYDEGLSVNLLIPCTVVNIEADSLTWVSAGNPALITFSENTFSLNVEAVQPLPGLAVNQTYKNMSVTFGDKERALLITDGIYENVNRTWSEARNIQQHLESCCACREEIRSAKSKKADSNLINCLWSNSLTAISKEIDDASLILLS